MSRTLLQSPICWIAFACGVAFLVTGGILLATPIASDDEPWRRRQQQLAARLARAADPAAAALAVASGDPASGELAARALASMSSLERRLADLDQRISAAGLGGPGAAGRPYQQPQPPGDSQQPQLAAMSNQISAMLTLMMAERQQALGSVMGSASAPALPQLAPPPAPAPLPPAPQAPPTIVIASPWAQQPQQAPQPQVPQPQWPMQPMQPQQPPQPAPAPDPLAKMKVLEESMENMTKRFDTMTKQLKFATQQADDRFARLFQNMVPAQHGQQDGSAGWAPGPTTAKTTDVKGHGCRAPPCSRNQDTCKANGNCCSDMMFEMLVDFSSYLTRRNVTHFLLAGTLLGAVRDQDIIPYTADIDMVIPREGWDKAMEINEQRDAPRSYYFQKDPEEPHCARLCPAWRDLPVNRQNFAEHFDWDVEQLSPDVPFYMDIYDEEMDFNQKLKHLFYPLSNVTIRNHTFPAPHESQIWVEARYGANWKTPDHNSREVGEAGYPTLDQAEAWSKNAVLLERVLRSPSASLRMLKHARLSHLSQQMYVEVSDLEGASPAHLKVQSVEVEGLRTSSDGAILEGALLVKPPADGQNDVTGFAMYWAADRIVDWDAQLEKIGAAVRLPRPEGAGGAGPPGAAAHTWRVPLPRTLAKPPNATHVALACVTEEGESTDFVLAPLDGSLAEGSADAEAVGFTETVSFGLLKVLHPADSAVIVPCVRGRFVLRSADFDEVINIMIRKTPDDMRRALARFAAWLGPIAQSLQNCRDERAHPIGGELEAILSHLSAPKQFDYLPGKQLDVDGKSLFLGINSLIGAFRKKEVSSFASFLGAQLLLFGPPAPGSGSLTTQDLQSPGALPPARPPPVDVQVAAESGAGTATAGRSGGGGGRARTLLSAGR